jgi:hypothetical protein
MAVSQFGDRLYKPTAIKNQGENQGRDAADPRGREAERENVYVFPPNAKGSGLWLGFLCRAERVA